MIPAFDAMFTIVPPPSSRCGSVYRHMRNVPVRFTPMMAAQCSGVSSSVRANPPIPAEFTSSCGRPRSLATASTHAWTDAGSLTSAPYARAVPPAAVMSSTVACAVSAARSTTATFAALGADQARRGAAEAGSRSGDDRDSIGETRHARDSPCAADGAI